MSTKIMAICWPLQMPLVAKAVYVSLADNANDYGDCWPSIATICERTCASERAVQNAIKWLEENGALEKNSRPNKTTLYRLTPELFKGESSSLIHYHRGTPAPRAPLEVQEMHPHHVHPHHVHPTPAPRAPLEVQEMHPNRNRTVIEPSINNIRLVRGTRLQADMKLPDEWAAFCKQERDDVDPLKIFPQFLDYWTAVSGSKGVKLDWFATWRNWVRNQRQQPQPRGSPQKKFDPTEYVNRNRLNEKNERTITFDSSGNPV